ncbi:hypothetical protein [Streptomyces sp. NPDC052535]|uniref:hypothetical protein n=1 Tax=Streptomyces sp. NPDC052535 TaxID=3155531 RepID=UPI003438CE3B
MIAILRTLWVVSLDSYARDNGIDSERTEIDLANYLTSSINDIAPFDEACGYATCITEHPAPQPPGQAAVRCDWRITIDREAWQTARGIGRQAARRDLLAYLVGELYSLPSVCDTDAVMTATYNTGRGTVRRTFQPRGRRRARSDADPD